MTTFPETSTVKAWNTYRAEMWHIPLAAGTCPECGGAGFIRAGDVSHSHPSFGKIEKCPVCSLPERRRWLAEHCGLRGPELEATGSSWLLGEWAGDLDAGCKQVQRRMAYQAMMACIQARAGLATFWGDFGSGKTLALQIVVNELRLRLVESFYSPMAAILDHLRDLYSRGLESSAFWQRLLDIPVLAVDEVSRINETAWARERLFVLIDTRYRRRDSHLTLFATNEDPRLLGDPGEELGYLFSRLRQGRLVELRGDMRRTSDRTP